MRETTRLVVPAEAAGARLDRFLASALTGVVDPPSRAELQRWIEHGRVTVDGTRKRAADKLREGSRIDVDPEPPPLATAAAEDGVVFRVMYTDDDVVVVDKPPGLVVHPARGHATGTLVNGLLAMNAFVAFEPDPPSEEMRIWAPDETPESFAHGRKRPAKSVTNAPNAPNAPNATATIDAPPYDQDKSELRLRPGIVHRLDKGTSGVMVVARTARAREALKEQFAAHTIEREYVALCNGEVKAKTFATLHGRHPTDRLRFTSNVGNPAAAKRAVTHVRPLESFGRSAATFVLCHLETGRTHQIRMHLSEGGTPVLGDPLYGKPSKNETVRAVADAIGHQALHARVLGFVHPTSGKTMRFEAPPPPDFELALETLRALPRK